MANLSGYTPIYIRTTGNDTTGDGSSGSPYATAQKGFDIAAATESGNYVLDFGVGSFGGVVLTQNWPSRVAVRGVGATQSFLGGITGDGADEVFDYELYEQVTPPSVGYSISLVSDLSINAGNITSNGGYGLSGDGQAGGSVTLTDTTAGNITANGTGSDINDGGAGGEVTLIGSAAGNIIVNAIDSAFSSGKNGGTVSVTASVVGDITANGGNSAPGSYGYSGIGGTVSVTASAVGDIAANGGRADLADAGGNGGTVSVTDGTAGSITAAGGLLWSEVGSSPSGAVTLAGSTIIPNSIVAASVSSVNLRKGRGVNGSSILGLI